MSLIEASLAPSFLEALARESLFKHPCDVIGMVGASCSPMRYQDSEEPIGFFLNMTEQYLLGAGHHLLSCHSAGNIGISPNPKVLVSEMNRESDFLQGAFKQANVKLLVISSVHYNPDQMIECTGGLSRQSPYALDESVWIDTFRETGAWAILNVYKSGDQESGEGISQLIVDTGAYNKVVSLSSVINYCGFEDVVNCADFRGADLFFLKDI